MTDARRRQMAIDAVGDEPAAIDHVGRHAPGIHLGKHFMALAAKLVGAGKIKTQVRKTDDKRGGEHAKEKSYRQLPMNNRPLYDGEYFFHNLTATTNIFLIPVSK